MGRGALRATVMTCTTRAHLIACHLKSKLLTFPGGFFSTTKEELRARVAAIAFMRRIAKATQVRLAVNHVMSQHPNNGVIVLGDLNDTPYATTSQLLVGPPGSKLGTRGFNIPEH